MVRSLRHEEHCAAHTSRSVMRRFLPAEYHADGHVVHLESILLRQEVAVEQLGERDGLEQEHVSLEGPEVDAPADVEGGDVSEGGRGGERG